MNKTVSINLGGQVFNIEEDAYPILKGYLDTIRGIFAGDPSGTEIMDDIEVRLAELFAERNNARKNVVVPADVEDVISIMGRPQDYRLDDEPAPQPVVEPSLAVDSKRKLYRDMDGAMLGGVCSGLSHLFGANVTVVRLLVVLLCFLSFGAAVLAYGLFWALVPPALTTSEKLHMRGESVNIESIGRIVNEESRAAADRLNKLGRTVGKNVGTYSTRGGRIIVRTIGRLFGLAITLFGFSLLIMLVVFAAFSEVNVFGFNGNNWDILNRLVFDNDGTLRVLAIGMVLAVIAPAIALIYFGLRLAIPSNRRIRGLGIALFSLFIIGVMMCIWGGVKTGKQFSRHAELNNTVSLRAMQSDTLVLDVLPDNVFIGRHSRYQNELFDLIKVTGDSIFYGQGTSVRFEPSTSQEFRMEIIRSSQGRNMEQAGNLARAIRYNYEVRLDTLSVGPYFTTPAGDPYRGQEIDIVIQVPIGKYVRFGKNSVLLTWQGDEEEVQRMTSDGLGEDVSQEPMDIDVDRADLETLSMPDSTTTERGNTGAR